MEKNLMCRMKKSLIANVVVTWLQEWSKMQNSYKNN
jgi:hypothetical protein